MHPTPTPATTQAPSPELAPESRDAEYLLRNLLTRNIEWVVTHPTLPTEKKVELLQDLQRRSESFSAQARAAIFSSHRYSLTLDGFRAKTPRAFAKTLTHRFTGESEGGGASLNEGRFRWLLMLLDPSFTYEQAADEIVRCCEWPPYNLFDMYQDHKEIGDEWPSWVNPLDHGALPFDCERLYLGVEELRSLFETPEGHHTLAKFFLADLNYPDPAHPSLVDIMTIHSFRDDPTPSLDVFEDPGLGLRQYLSLGLSYRCEDLKRRTESQARLDRAGLLALHEDADALLDKIFGVPKPVVFSPNLALLHFVMLALIRTWYFDERELRSNGLLLTSSTPKVFCTCLGNALSAYAGALEYLTYFIHTNSQQPEAPTP